MKYLGGFLLSSLAVSETKLLQLQFGVGACVRPDRFVQAITCTFVHGFQNNLSQLFSLRRRSAIRDMCSGRLKVMLALEDQMMQ